MSLYVDHQFASRISPKLELFTKKRAHIYNFRCPFCKDSKKSKTKARGYFYAKVNDLYFRCHNCGRGYTLGSFIEKLDPSLYREYQLERYKEGAGGKSHIAVPKFKSEKPVFKERNEVLSALDRIDSLPAAHVARAYVEFTRLIPARYFASLYYAPDFKAFINDLVPEQEQDDLIEDDPRLIIPFYDAGKRLIAVQGRALNPDSTLRYITIKTQDVPRIYGMDRYDSDKHGYVVEGPIDSMFVQNCIAAAGADMPKLDKEKWTYIYDNEPRSYEITRRVREAVDDGRQIFIWPSHVKQKDINDLVTKAGMTAEEIKLLIDENTSDGLHARLAFMNWKKC
jgi:transcription elongation factor Elf1